MRKGNCRRSEEHTSELQSLRHLVCRLLLEKKKRTIGHASEGGHQALGTPKSHYHGRCTGGDVPDLQPMAPCRSGSLGGFCFSFFFLMIGRPPISTLFPYTALSR